MVIYDNDMHNYEYISLSDIDELFEKKHVPQ